MKLKDHIHQICFYIGLLTILYGNSVGIIELFSVKTIVQFFSLNWAYGLADMLIKKEKGAY